MMAEARRGLSGVLAGCVTLEGHADKVHCLAWNVDGSCLASGSMDRSVRVWKGMDVPRTGSAVELAGHGDSVEQVRWNPTSVDEVASASSDCTVRFWDMRSGTCTRSVTTGTAGNLSICWSPCGRYVAVSNSDDVLSILDARAGCKVVKTYKFNFEINEIGWDRSGTRFLITSSLGTVEIMRPGEEEEEEEKEKGGGGGEEGGSSSPGSTLSRQGTLAAHTASIHAMEFDPTGTYFALGGADTLVSLWDVEEGACVRTFTCSQEPVRCLSFSGCGTVLAVAGDSPSVEGVVVANGGAAFSIPARAPTNDCAFCPRKDRPMALALAEDRPGPGAVRLFHSAAM